LKRILVEVLVDEDILKETYLREACGSESEDELEEYSFSDALSGELGWLEQSGIRILDWRAVQEGVNV
jgi:hypothetical protein